MNRSQGGTDKHGETEISARPAQDQRLALVGAVANVFGQLGDLSMSLIKREAGIKDYSHLFLTHGGMLDRFDSTMFIAPVVYFFVAGGIL